MINRTALSIGLAATLTLVQNPIATSLTNPEINNLAKKITVLVTNSYNNGSGVIVQKQGNTYTVLTNCHVVEAEDTYTIETHEGKTYALRGQPQCHDRVDLALIQFSSSEDYTVAELGDSDSLGEGETIYVSGWQSKTEYNPKPSYRFYQGAIAGIQPDARKGYQLVHSATSVSGMSGGSLLNADGKLLGINGLVYTELNTHVSQFLAIPINFYQNWQGVATVPGDKPTRSEDKPTRSTTPQLSPTAEFSLVPTVDYSITYTNINDVDSIAITTDQEILASTDGETIKIWNLTTGHLENTLEGHSDWVNRLAITPDGRQLISGSWDKTIKIWNLTTGRLQKTLEGHSDSVRSLAITPDGRQLISGSSDNTIKIWNLTTGRLENTLEGLEGHSDWVNRLAITPDGRQLISSSSDNTIKIWNLTTGRLQKTLEGHSHSVASLAITPDGRQFISGSSDNKEKTIKIWNLTTGRLQKTFIVSGGADADIRVWTLQNQ